MSDVKKIYSVVWDELGLLNMTVVFTRRVMEPLVLASYWSFLFLGQVWSNAMELDDKGWVIQDSNIFIQFLVAMSEICETPMILISFCLVIMIMSGAVLTVARKILSSTVGQVGQGTPDVQIGMTEGVITFVLALQTGLIDLEMPARVGGLSIILFVVMASLIQSCLEVTMPSLLSMPGRNKKWFYHLPPLLLTFLLLLAPLLMVHTLLTHISSALWTLVIVSSCLVTAVQAVGCLVTYVVFVFDSFSPSPHTDDYVYYVKAVTRAMEVILAVAVVSSGFYESFVESGDWDILNTLVLLIHCYFNIYSRLSQGWASYLARRQTSMRLSELSVASEEELSAHSDVCSICYQNMEEVGTVVKTECRHYFHTHCLRRWLVVQDNCPLCTQSIVAGSDKEEDKHKESSDVNIAEEVVQDVTLEEVIQDDERVAVEVDLTHDESANIISPSCDGLRQRPVVGGGGQINNLFEGD